MDNSEAIAYQILGVNLELPIRILTPTIRKAFDAKKYEHLEARQIGRLMQDGDRLLEIGAGVGFISALAATTWKLEECVVVEGNPELVEIIRKTHELNNVESNIFNGVAISSYHAINESELENGKIDFFIRSDFWGSSTNSETGFVKSISVPIIEIQDLVSQYKPTIVVCDIEGGEYELFDNVKLEGVRSILIEIHKNKIGLSGINHMMNSLARENLFYDPDFSVGAVVCFSKE